MKYTIKTHFHDCLTKPYLIPVIHGSSAIKSYDHL